MRKNVSEKEREIEEEDIETIMMPTWNTRGKKTGNPIKGLQVSPAFRVFLEEDLRFPR